MWYVVAGGLLVALYVFQFEPRWFRVRREVVQTGKRASLLLLTDIHVGWGRVGRRELLKTISRVIGEVDAVLIGGDPIDAHARYYPVLEAWLRELVALGKPVYAVYGDHDHHHAQCSLEQIAGVYSRAGVTLLDNEITRIGGLTLLGMRDISLHETYAALRQGKPQAARMYVESLTEELPPADFVLVHNPDGVYHPSLSESAVVLAGHTHGGQYAPVRWLRIPVPPGSFRSWAGRMHVANRTLIVSRGCGSSTLPGRFLVRPEVVVVKSV